MVLRPLPLADPLEAVRASLMRHYADADALLPMAVRGCYSACDLFVAKPSTRPKPKKKDDEAPLHKVRHTRWHGPVTPHAPLGRLDTWFRTVARPILLATRP